VARRIARKSPAPARWHAHRKLGSRTRGKREAREVIMEDQKKVKVVYTVVERGEGKSFWVRVGVGSTNRDGSLNLRLDAIPVNGLLQVRDWEPYDRRSDTAETQARPRLRAPDPAVESLV
jgi:hypothetical protein